MPGDLKSTNLIHLKGWLFLVIGVLASALIVAETQNLRVAALLGIAIWSFCRAYYYAFYVIENTSIHRISLQASDPSSPGGSGVDKPSERHCVRTAIFGRQNLEGMALKKRPNLLAWWPHSVRLGSPDRLSNPLPRAL